MSASKGVCTSTPEGLYDSAFFGGGSMLEEHQGKRGGSSADNDSDELSDM